jgi:hypothetical protein
VQILGAPGEVFEGDDVTTAREKLYEEVIAMVAQPASATAESEMRKVMARYRVQTKPGVDIPPGATARDALGDRLLELWRQQPEDIKARIGTSIDEFRMQLKSSSSPPSPAKAAAPRPRPTLGAGPPLPAVEDDEEEPPNGRGGAPARDPAPPPAASATRPVAALGIGEAPAPTLRNNNRPARAGAEPVAGGPRKRGRTRGECPKCHSMGVVLARSYSGDEYFSCIYCGWQAYKPTEDDDPNASLAVRLLGQTPSESSRE